MACLLLLDICFEEGLDVVNIFKKEFCEDKQLHRLSCHQGWLSPGQTVIEQLSKSFTGNGIIICTSWYSILYDVFESES